MKLLLTTLLLATALFGQQNTVFRRNVFQGITTTQASAAMPNIGQAVHLVTLIYPAAVADVTSFTFRVEASYDNTTYFAISEDITTAKYNGSYAYAITRCNGVYPYVRLRLVTANASNALTAHYTGSLQPIGIVRFETDRYIAASPLAGPIPSGPGLSINGDYYVYGRKMTPIVTTDWTSTGLNASTIRTDGNGFITLDTEPDGNWGFVCKALPTAPYTIRIHYIIRSGYAGGDAPNLQGAALRNSADGKFIAAFVYAGGTFIIRKQTLVSGTGNGDYLNNGNWRFWEPIVSLSIQDDGSAFRYFYWWDGQGTYQAFDGNNERSGRTDHTTPNQICFGAQNTNGNYRTRATLVGYDANPTW